MQARPFRPNMALVLIAFTVLFGILLACARSIQTDADSFWSVSGVALIPAATQPGVVQEIPVAAARQPGDPIQTPTPDDPHPLPDIRIEPEQYTVQANDTLGIIANKYGVSLEQIAQANSLANIDLLEIGQVLQIPAPTPEGAGPDFKIIPDSELVYGPGTVSFDLAAFVQAQGGHLLNYQETVDGVVLNGAQVVERIAKDFSVNPRLLLAVLEYQSGWVTQANPGELEYPMGIREPARKGLFLQLAWAANNLNRGYYLWRVNGAAAWLLGDSSLVPISPVINAGTAAVQQLFALLYGRDEWLRAVSPEGVFTTYQAFFGYPFDYTVEPLLPVDLAQPVLQLPFEAGQQWAYTGGPHGGWGDGSGWAALDFAPPGEALGCVQSDDWVVAVAGGLITRAGIGAVIQDLDGDGHEGTGWVILYMHIETRDRVEPGTILKAGDRIGHPSCEGGRSTGTHVHLARRYNGEWISADQGVPFILDGWVSYGQGYEYNGVLQRDGRSIEAYAGRSEENGIQR